MIIHDDNVDLTCIISPITLPGACETLGHIRHDMYLSPGYIYVSCAWTRVGEIFDEAYRSE